MEYSSWWSIFTMRILIRGKLHWSSHSARINTIIKIGRKFILDVFDADLTLVEPLDDFLLMNEVYNLINLRLWLWYFDLLLETFDILISFLENDFLYKWCNNCYDNTYRMFILNVDFVTNQYTNTTHVALTCLFDLTSYMEKWNSYNNRYHFKLMLLLTQIEYSKSFIV